MRRLAIQSTRRAAGALVSRWPAVTAAGGRAVLAAYLAASALSNTHQRQGDVYFPVHEVPFGRKASCGQDVLHLVIFRHCFGVEECDAVLLADGNEVLEQEGGYSVPVQVVGDGKGDLRVTRRSNELVARDTCQPAGNESEQRYMVLGCGPAYPPGLMLGGLRAEAEEAQVQVVSGHLCMHGTDRAEVGWLGLPDLRQAAVRELPVKWRSRLHGRVLTWRSRSGFG